MSSHRFTVVAAVVLMAVPAALNGQGLPFLSNGILTVRPSLDQSQILVTPIQDAATNVPRMDFSALTGSGIYPGLLDAYALGSMNFQRIDDHTGSYLRQSQPIGVPVAGGPHPVNVQMDLTREVRFIGTGNAFEISTTFLSSVDARFIYLSSLGLHWSFFSHDLPYADVRYGANANGSHAAIELKQSPTGLPAWMYGTTFSGADVGAFPQRQSSSVAVPIYIGSTQYLRVLSDPNNGQGSGFDGGEIMSVNVTANAPSTIKEYIVTGATIDDVRATYSAITGIQFADPVLRSLTTTSHPLPSTFQMSFYVGDPRSGGTKVGGTSPIEIAGQFEGHWELDSRSSGEIYIDVANLTIADHFEHVDLGPLGSIDFDLSNIGITLMSNPLEVHQNQVVVDYLGGFDLRWDTSAGHVDVANLQGIFATLPIDTLLKLDPASDEIRFNPTINMLPKYNLFPPLWEGLPIHVTGTADDDASGLFNGPELNISTAGNPLFLGNSSLGPVYVEFDFDLHFAVPEPSSVVLAGAIAFVAGMLTLWRKMKRCCCQ